MGPFPILSEILPDFFLTVTFDLSPNPGRGWNMLVACKGVIKRASLYEEPWPTGPFIPLHINVARLIPMQWVSRRKP
jgi:hypothetical protein